MNADGDMVFPHLEFGYSVLRIMAQLMRATRTRQGSSRAQLANRMNVVTHRLTQMEDPQVPSQQIVDLIRYCIWMKTDPCALIDDACAQYRKNGSRSRPHFTITETILPAPPALFGLDPLRADVVASQTRRLMIQAREKAPMTVQTMGKHLGCSDLVILRMEYSGPSTPDRKHSAVGVAAGHEHGGDSRPAYAGRLLIHGCWSQAGTGSGGIQGVPVRASRRTSMAPAPCLTAVET